MTAPSPAPVSSTGSFEKLVALVCLAGLGGLCGGTPMAVFGPLLILVGLLPLKLLLGLFNPQARHQAGFRGIRSAIFRGFVMLVPFTVLAAVSDFWLHWNAAQVFASSGLMAAGAAAGYEMIKIGGGRIAGTLLPTLWFALMSAGWMLLASFLAKVIQ